MLLTSPLSSAALDVRHGHSEKLGHSWKRATGSLESYHLRRLHCEDAQALRVHLRGGDNRRRFVSPYGVPASRGQVPSSLWEAGVPTPSQSDDRETAPRSSPAHS